MDNQEKIRIKREIGRWAEGSDFAEVDLILSECGLEPLSNFMSGIRPYVYQALETATDWQLMDFYYAISIIPGEITNDEIGNSKNTFTELPIKLFVSHLTGNRSFVSKVCSKLRSYGIATFVAHQDIEPASEWPLEIESALNECNVLAVFLTKGVHESKWVDHETAFAYARAIPIIPISFGVLPYGIIERIQAHDIANEIPNPDRDLQAVDKTVTAILQTLTVNSKTAALMQPSFIKSLRLSKSFDQTRSIWSRIKKERIWDEEALSDLKTAQEENFQVSKCDPVSFEIQKILIEFNEPF